MLRHRFAAHLLGLAKPDRTIYETVTAELGVAPDQILFFDDRADNVASARACGWRAEHIDPARETVPQVRLLLDAHGVRVG